MARAGRTPTSTSRRPRDAPASCSWRPGFATLTEEIRQGNDAGWSEELEADGLAHGRRTGREIRYDLDTAPLAEAEAWMRSIGASWDRRLTVLKRLLEAPTGGTGEEE